MKTIASELLKNIIRRTAFIVTAYTVISSIGIQPSIAASQTLTGQCGFLISRNHSGFDARKLGSDRVGTTMAGILDFSNSSGYSTLTVVDNYGQADAVNSERGGFSFQIAIQPSAISGIYTLTWFQVTPDNTQYTLVYNLIPTNNGKTFLIESIPAPDWNTGTWTGVCQAL
mgnify:CR=1 FL=1